MSENSKLLQKAEHEICRRLGELLLTAGFRGTKNRFWTREHPHTIDVIHLHRHGISAAAVSTDFRVHFAIRVLNDPFEAIGLNGPSSDPLPKGYHFGFNAKNETTFGRCVADLHRYCLEYGEPWFKKFGDPAVLLDSPVSPLKSEDKEALRNAINGRMDLEAVRRSMRLLGLKGR